MKAKLMLDELNEWLEQQGIEDRVTYSPPATKEDIQAAQERVGCALPPSYVEFVTRYGAFGISEDLMGRSLPTELLLPKDLADITLNLRAEMVGDSDSEDILNDALAFCGDPVDEYYHLFVISSADDEGEMATRGYDYQDPACSDPWYEGDGPFESLIANLVENVRKKVSRR